MITFSNILVIVNLIRKKSHFSIIFLKYKKQQSISCHRKPKIMLNDFWKSHYGYVCDWIIDYRHYSDMCTEVLKLVQFYCFT